MRIGKGAEAAVRMLYIGPPQYRPTRHILVTICYAATSECLLGNCSIGQWVGYGNRDNQALGFNLSTGFLLKQRTATFRFRAESVPRKTGHRTGESPLEHEHSESTRFRKASMPLFYPNFCADMAAEETDASA
jgi:hypothetical protein